MQERMTLYELNALVRETLEESFPDTCWVQGELAEGRVGYGGHFYGELVQKDEKGKTVVARARVNCWQRVYALLSANFERETGESLRAGLQVMMEVRVTFHEQYGYSLSILDIDPSYTLGDMAVRRRQILEQLEADGILHDNQTLPLPLLMQRIAVISSETAAGYGDFLNQLHSNDYGLQFHTRLFPAVMQGQHVEESIIGALSQIAEEAGQWDAVVIIRGGGATTDLSDFDSYALAACICQMAIPVITGIGHERDETVLDHVAHTHLKTPTAVAAFLIEHEAAQLQRLDELGMRIGRAVNERLQTEVQRTNEYTVRLQLISSRILEQCNNYIQTLAMRLQTATHNLLTREAHKQELMATRLQSLDPDLMLRRGYSMTLVEGRLVSDASQLTPGQQVVTRLGKGEITSTINEIKA